MDRIYVKSKMKEEDFRRFLLYNQYYSERHYFFIRIAVSIIIGLISGYFSSDKLITFILISVICIAVFVAFPWFAIKFRYKKIYRRNRSTAFSQNQIFLFEDESLKFRNENEFNYYEKNYEELKRVVETNTLFIICYSKKQNAILVKRMIGADNVKFIRDIFMSKIKNKYTRIERF